MDHDINDIVIVGAGQSGAWAAKTLRDQGFTGSVTLIGDEVHLPYERPPLSKAVLLGLAAPDVCTMWPQERFAELDVQTELGRHVAHIDIDACSVICNDGKSFRYDRALLATGSRPRRLTCEGSELKGVHYLRTIDDCLTIRGSLGPDARIVVVGGGWIGLEVASGLRARGAHVTVLEASRQLCGRSLPASLSDYFLTLHREHGVDVMLDARVRRIIGPEIVEGVELDDGSVLPATVVVVGIGAVPNDELARACGLEVGNGIVVDEHCRTSDTRIYACGDVTDQPWGTARIRLESWKNAQDQGIAAAKALLGARVAPKEMPWFWSDQFDINFQMLGIVPADAEQYRKPNVRGDGFIDYFLREGEVMAVAAVNSPRELREAKRAIEKALTFSSNGLTAVHSPKSNARGGLVKRL
ncbi:NAD(P)/FAD-dependent oxidoreductase [Variovorax sp. ZT4R33]|uniref:NAD(P)/FAD-dependent oxidoreductase n=1 Tax=Variovorax sp. ZT4R33 TaxID=3443743 RepID=UPI003F453388